ncbi:uncharacterized protein LOC131203523 [Ahaetulla prasina]|uniref:uncharacterized protein LOC131203523 n=1 Tax=Ahaetulla prasina TaxID=499056 RepID=UPI0026490EB2|nr:uncharacterized protein LOC131203523 [Ahaetulla prasina]
MKKGRLLSSQGCGCLLAPSPSEGGPRLGPRRRWANSTPSRDKEPRKALICRVKRRWNLGNREERGAGYPTYAPLLLEEKPRLARVEEGAPFAESRAQPQNPFFQREKLLFSSDLDNCNPPPHSPFISAHDLNETASQSLFLAGWRQIQPWPIAASHSATADPGGSSAELLQVRSEAPGGKLPSPPPLSTQEPGPPGPSLESGSPPRSLAASRQGLLLERRRFLQEKRRR